MPGPSVFISYSHKNTDWVRNWLLPKIESQGIQTRVDFRDFEIGTPSLINMERAVDECAKTILVFTPEWLNSEWTQFEGLMLMVQDPIGMRKRILPLMLVDCELPTRLKIFTYADFREKEEWDFQFERMTSQIKKDFAAQVPLPQKYPPLDEKNVDIRRLPQSAFELFGRQTELGQLDQAWESDKTNIICFVAYGGVGKTTLVNKWAEKMRWDNYRGAKRVFAWSFYSQGTGDRVTSADLFIAEALKWFGDPKMANSNASAWDKGGRLAELVQSEKTLLLLDGMEPLQSGLNFERGKIKDPALAVLVTELAKNNPGLCVITTREFVPELADFPDTTLETNLEQISAEAGRALLRVGGVQGTDAELEQAAFDFGLHALALNLLAAYIHEIPGHHVSNTNEIPDLDVPLKEGKHPRRVMFAFAKRFGDDSAEVELLRILGLFSSPAEKEELAAVRAEPPIPNLTVHIQNLPDGDWLQLVTKLRRLKLIAPESEHHHDSLDAHPLVREHFGKQLKQEFPDAWREGNDRLYEYYKVSAKEYPDTLEEMTPLYAAVIYGCQAGKHQEARDEVYWRRIQRGEESFNTKKLGAIGSELAVLSYFFNPPWYEPVEGLREGSKGWVLNEVGYDLRALGRLAEAGQSMQRGLNTAIRRETWNNAASSANNLSELYLTIGDVKQALAYAEQSVQLADRSGEEFLRMSSRTTLGNALHQAGRLSESRAAFQQAEEIKQQMKNMIFQTLASIAGFLYCDLLLSQANYTEVERRASQTLKWSVEQQLILETALDNLSLGRARLLQSQREPAYPITISLDYLNRAVDGLRKSGYQDDIPRGLLARLEYYRLTNDLVKAKRDLDEAFTIASRGGMGLFLADCHLESVRWYLAKGDKATAKENWKIAKEKIEQMGYHRRDKEVDELEKAMSL